MQLQERSQTCTETAGNTQYTIPHILSEIKATDGMGRNAVRNNVYEINYNAVNYCRIVKEVPNEESYEKVNKMIVSRVNRMKGAVTNVRSAR